MGKNIGCIICILILLTPPVVIFALSFVTHVPKFYIEDFYIPALNNATHSNATVRLNTFIFIDLKLENVMPFNGLRYDNVSLNITFNMPNRSSQVATYMVPGFYQGIKKTAHMREVIRTRDMPWNDVFDEVSNGSTVRFGVDLVTYVKLKRCGIYTRRRKMVAKGNLMVDGSGEEVDKKTVRLVKTNEF